MRRPKTPRRLGSTYHDGQPPLRCAGIEEFFVASKGAAQGSEGMLTTEFFRRRKKLCPDLGGTICGRKLAPDHVTGSNLRMRTQRQHNARGQRNESGWNSAFISRCFTVFTISVCLLWQLSIVQVGLHSEVPLETKTGRCGAATRLAGQWIFRALGKPGASNVLRLLSEQSKASSLSSGGIES